MKNKVDIIEGAISQCKRLINNESIELNGLHRLTITRGNLTDPQLNERIMELEEEKQNLCIKIMRMSKTK
jgi:16S rRNA U516 pseudouridylate synthase RsuA-like enzyme